MSSIDDKIRAFLEAAGYDYDEATSSRLQLIRYFEQEYDAQILKLLESEWVDEQISHDVRHGAFSEVRKHIGREHHRAFDRLVHDLFAGEEAAQAPQHKKGTAP